MPLAIELAAARIAMFSVEQIAARIDQAVRLLSGGARTAPARQQTLRATLDWSYSLLAEADSALLDRLSMFVGGWTFEAAEAVGDITPDVDVLAMLGGLVDRSLVVAETSVAGAVRYRLLEVVRQYGQERLARRGVLDEARRAHAAYFLALAERAAPQTLGPQRKAWLDQLESELDNLRAARRWFVESGATEEAMRLAAALYRLWMYRGYAEEGRASLGEALAMSGGSPAARANALFCDGGLGVAVFQSDFAAAQRHLEESLALRRQIGDQVGIAWALMGVGAAATMATNFEVASATLPLARAASQECGDQAVLALSLTWSADLAYGQGDFASARAFGEEALRVANGVGFALPACLALSTLGTISWREGQLNTAERLLPVGARAGRGAD